MTVCLNYELKMPRKLKAVYKYKKQQQQQQKFNVSKTKDFRKNQRCSKPVYIKGEAVERVDTYRYLGVVFDSKLNWKENINSVLKNVNSRMYYMRKLRSFEVNSDMPVTFYNAVISSSIMFGSVCWGGNISKLDRRRLEKIVKKQVM